MIANYILPASIDQEKAATILVKAKYTFAAIFKGVVATASTEEVAEYYEVTTSEVLDILGNCSYEFENDLNGDNWTPRAILRLGLLINCPIGSLVRDTALNIIEAVAKTSVKAKVKSLFADIDFVGWSNREIAKILECSKDAVRHTRQELEEEGKIPTTLNRRVKRGEAVYELTKSSHPNCKEMYLATSSQMSHSNTDATERKHTESDATVTISSPSHPRYGQAGVIAAEPPNHWQQIVEFPDGSRELIRNNELDAGSVDYPQKTYTLTEAELQAEISRAIEEAKLGFLTELEAIAQQRVLEIIQAKDAVIAQLRSKSAQLEQQIDELKSLRHLEKKNAEMQQRIEELENAVEERAYQQWNNTFNKQATKALNKDVLERIEALEPELHLRYLAQGLPSPELRSVVLNLLGQAIANLIPDGISEYRSKLEHAASWQDFEPVTQEWKSLKHNLWAELTKLERQKITDLKNAPSPPFKVGDRVIYLGDAYDAQSGCVGEVVGIVFSDFKVWWRKYDGSSFESRHSINEIQLEVQRVSA